MGCEQSADSIFFRFLKFCHLLECPKTSYCLHCVCERPAAEVTVLHRSSEQLDKRRASDTSFHMGFLCTCPPCCEFSQPTWQPAYYVPLLCWQLQLGAQAKLDTMIMITHFPGEGGRGAENQHVTFPIFFQDASLHISFRQKKFSLYRHSLLCMVTEGCKCVFAT